jgi:hypothetical protein
MFILAFAHYLKDLGLKYFARVFFLSGIYIFKIRIDR